MIRVFYAEAVYGQEEIDAALGALKNAHSLVCGESVARLEERVSGLFGKRLGLMVNSGSSANTLAIAALGLPRGAEVITPVLTFSTTVSPLVQQGLVPAFVDVEPDTYTIDAAKVEEMVGPETKGMMIPDLIGNLPDWTALRAIADRHGLTIIEDSADTIGSLYDGAPTGALTDVVTTSFYATHLVTCAGFGGMVCFDDPELERRARLLRGWGRSSSLTQESESIEDRFDISVDGIPYDRKFVFEAAGYNFLPSEVGAAFGLVQLDKLDRFIETRIRNFEALLGFFKDYEEWFVLPRQRENTRTGWLALPLVVRDEAPFSRRDLQIHLETKGVQTRTVFAGNVLRHPGFRGLRRRESPQGYPNADQVMRGGLLLGCHHGMTPDHVDYIRATFRDFAQAR